MRGIGDVDSDGMPDSMFKESSGQQRYNVVSSQSNLVIRSHPGASPSDADAVPDANADGIDDYVIGIGGSQGGPGTATLYSGATGAVIQTVAGGALLLEFGSTIAGVGDLDGDGRGDFVVGAPVTDEPTLSLFSAGWIGAYSSATGNQLWSIYGAAPQELLGESVARLGDVNSDGVDDIVCGSRSRIITVDGATGTILNTLTPAIAGVNGFTVSRESLCSFEDINNDNIPDYAVSTSGSSGTEVWIRSGADSSLLRTHPAVQGGYGVAVTDAGDVDGDGHADLLVGSFRQGGQFVSEVFLYSGADGSLLWSITGADLQMIGLGASVSSIGDLTGDGLNEVLIGASGHYPSQNFGAFIFDLSSRNYPGSQDDLFLTTAVGGGALTYQDSKVASSGGDLLELHFESPNGILNGSIPYLLADIYPTIRGSGTIPNFPSIHMDPSSFLVLYNATAFPLIQVLPSQGMTFAFNLPVGLSGVTLLLQAIAISPLATNGLIASSDAHEIRFL